MERKGSLKTIIGLFFIVSLTGFFIYLSFVINQTPKLLKSKASESSKTSAVWLENDRSAIRNSAWISNHQYGDCPDQNIDGFWSILRLDCIFPDKLDGPSEQDKKIVQEPPNLYYKHMIPGDFIKLFSDIPLPSVFAWIRNEGSILSRNEMREKIKSRIQNKKTDIATISVDSLMVGLEGATSSGKVVSSVSLMVHPQLEQLFVDIVGTPERARILYQPFIEGAIGRKLKKAESQEVHNLYTAALYDCGKHALNGVQTGLGKKYQFGNYTAVVQWWTTGDGTSDCNIHVVKAKTP